MWVRIDDATPYHPKMFHVGVCAFGWWTAALAYCNRNLTDGFIPERDYLLVYPGTPADKVLGMIDMLVAERLLEKRSDHEVGVQVHDYLKYQTSRKDVLHIRRARSIAGRKGGEKTRKKDRANCSQFALSNLLPLSSHSDSQSQSHTQSLERSTAALTFHIPESVVAALKRAPRLGGVGLLQEPRFWQAELRANPGVDFAAEVLKAEAWIAANPRKAPSKDLPRFLHNWLARAER